MVRQRDHAPSSGGHNLLMSLADDLADWTDWDGAAYHLGRALGLLEGLEFIQAKHIFWTNNELGEGLHDAVQALARTGMLERRDEPNEQFRWAR
jgi:hypothetical protein